MSEDFDKTDCINNIDADKDFVWRIRWTDYNAHRQIKIFQRQDKTNAMNFYVTLYNNSENKDVIIDRWIMEDLPLGK